MLGTAPIKVTSPLQSLVMWITAPRDRERKPDAETDPGHAVVKRRWLQALDDLGPEQTDADEHGAEGTAPRSRGGNATPTVALIATFSSTQYSPRSVLGSMTAWAMIIATRRHGDAESAGDEQGTG